MTIRLFPAPPGHPGDAGALTFTGMARYRAAALHARRVLPGPLGELVARELTAHADFAHRVGDGHLIERLTAHVLDEDPPQPSA